MPVVSIQSAEGKMTHKASYKRRSNQNSEIKQLESLLPWSQKGSSIDKISVLRLTSAYLRFKNFWQSAFESSDHNSKAGAGFDRLFSEALDGFLLILSSDSEIVFVSEGISESVGLSQQEVIGLSIYELSHEDDVPAIKDCLKPDGSLQLQQSRHFYMRFKTSIAPVKKQLSKFGGTVMMQVSGRLKLSRNRGGGGGEPLVIGLVAECRRIESSSSILELKVSQTLFTSTTTMDLKILNIDTKMKTVTGFNSDIEGSVLTNFFHPADNRRSIHCLKTLLITGQAVSPIIRFMTHTGEWVWVQIEGLVRYEQDNRTPKYLEATFKVVCASDKSVKMIEQKELYGKCSDPTEGNGIHADSRFDIPATPKVTSPEAVVKSIEDTNVSVAVRDVLLHGRETALSAIPLSLQRLATWPEVRDAVVEYETSQGLPPNYNPPFPQPDPMTSLIAANQSGSSYSSPKPSPLSDITPSESSVSSPSSIINPAPPPGDVTNGHSSPDFDVESVSVQAVESLVHTPPSAQPSGVGSSPLSAYSPSSSSLGISYSPSQSNGGMQSPINEIYTPPTVAANGTYLPPTVPFTGAYSPSNLPSTGAYSPSTMPAYSPSTMPAYSPSTMSSIGAYSSSSVPLTGAYSPSNMSSTSTMPAYSPSHAGGYPPSVPMTGGPPLMGGVYSPPTTSPYSSSLPVANKQYPFPGLPTNPQQPFPQMNGCNSAVPPLHHEYHGGTNLPMDYIPPLGYNQPQPPTLSHIPYSTGPSLSNPYGAVINGSFEVSVPPPHVLSFYNDGVPNGSSNQYNLASHISNNY